MQTKTIEIEIPKGYQADFDKKAGTTIKGDNDYYEFT